MTNKSKTVAELIRRAREAGHDSLGIANDPEWVYRGVVQTIPETLVEWNPYGSAVLVSIVIFNWFVVGILLSCALSAA